ncbi:T9SS type A sorting domain-containing protein [Candidatus Eisenbacteria bacterium]|uniref:T9SS type A sorting domain-containing protein n=1 Tax=Eiseniibacteriota bacterium TaxID=2212470 RepID=A0ABV6YLD4_UNCEI
MHRCVAAILLGLMIPFAASATTYLITPDGTGDFPTIQAAITAATPGDTVALANGVFTGDGNRDLEILDKGITVRSQSGNPELCIINCQGSAVDPHRGIHIDEDCDGVSIRCVLEGITIANGYSTGNGGGVLCGCFGWITLSNCILLGNTADGSGGGLYIEGTGWSLVASDCVFTGNSAVTGGAAAFPSAMGESIILSRCSILYNDASGAGGGVFIQEEGFADNISLGGCVIEGNTAAGSGGGVMSYVANGIYVSGCTFRRNEASTGGGICTDVGPLFLTGSTIVDNKALSGNGGGVACLSGVFDVIEGCAFSENLANGNGGGLFCVCPHYDYGSFGGNTFAGNTAAVGGGVMYEFGDDCGIPLLVGGCTFAQNSASEGSGIAFSGVGSGEIRQTIIASGLESEAVHVAGESPITLSCSDVYGNEGGDWVGSIADQYGTEGNISLDPLFCDADGGDFGLQDCSPCAPFSPPNDSCGLIGVRPVDCGCHYACCISTECQLLEQDECLTAGGEWLYDVDSCDPNTCSLTACCTYDLCDIIPMGLCYEWGGIPFEWESCEPSGMACVGCACCFGDECNEWLLAGECIAAGGVVYDVFAGCDPNPCVVAACCVDLDCFLVSADECFGSLGGAWYEEWDTCDPDPCAVGACCIGANCSILERAECVHFSGIFYEGWDSCEPSPCQGACCLATEAACHFVSADSCGLLGGVFLGGNCEPNTCVGACCFQSGLCLSLPMSDCDATGVGIFGGFGTACEPNPCTAVCCLDSGGCVDTTLEACQTLGGHAMEMFTSCDGDTCPPGGACCFSDGSCQILTGSLCVSYLGDWRGEDIGCDPNPCIGACFDILACECFLVVTDSVQAQCTHPSGYYHAQFQFLGAGSLCPIDSNSVEGACCFSDECDTLSCSVCNLITGGLFLGPHTLCHPDSCADSGIQISDVPADRIHFSRPIPNPTLGAVTFRIELPEDSAVGLRLFDVTGKVVSRVVDDEHYAAGVYVFSLEPERIAGRGLPAGIYYLRLDVGEFGETRKIVVAH